MYSIQHRVGNTVKGIWQLGGAASPERSLTYYTMKCSCGTSSQSFRSSATALLRVSMPAKLPAAHWLSVARTRHQGVHPCMILQLDLLGICKHSARNWDASIFDGKRIVVLLCTYSVLNLVLTKQRTTNGSFLWRYLIPLESYNSI